MSNDQILTKLVVRSIYTFLQFGQNNYMFGAVAYDLGVGESYNYYLTFIKDAVKAFKYDWTTDQPSYDRHYLEEYVKRCIEIGLTEFSLVEYKRSRNNADRIM